jgi:acyl carrier protein
LQFASLGFDAAAEEIYPTLCAGATLVLRTEDTLSSVQHFLTQCRQWDITVLDLPTAYWHVLAAELTARADLTVPPSVRSLVVGGERLDPHKVAAWHQKFGDRVQLFNSYGPTETTVVATACQLQPYAAVEEDLPIGRPLGNVETYVLDERQNPVPIGIPGELYIGGVPLARGYLNRSDLSAEGFVPHPFGSQPGARLYRTGDLARYRRDGQLDYLGRADHQVKIRGFRVELGEIETAIAACPGVGEVAVVVREDRPQDKRLVAYLVLHDPSDDRVAQWRDALQGQLPEYMIPTAWVVLDALPLTPNGKVDRRGLPAPTDPQRDETSQAPRTPTEARLCQMWSDLLGVEGIGTDDDFFALGGHSLLATQLMSRIRTAFRVELPLRSLFERRTVARLARQIERLQPGEVGDIQPVSRDRPLPLSFAQERIWLLDRLQPGNEAYNIPAAVRLHGSLDFDALARSFNEMARRHETLRTAFGTVAGNPVQIVAPSADLTPSVIDLRSLPQPQRERQMQEAIAAEIQRPFDLERTPLARATLWELAETESVLLLVVHHAVSDGWSMGVFFRELAVLYDAFRAGRPSPLPPLPIQYADFAVWQREQLQSSVLPAQLAYWQQKLAGARAPQLPLDSPRPKTPKLQGGSHLLELSQELTQGLKALSERSGITLFMTLLAALNILLARHTGETDITVGTDVANRHRRELEGLIGFFINILVLRTDLSDNPSFQTLLARVRQTALEAYACQDLSFSQLVANLPQQSPLFQVLLVVQNTPVPDIELTDLTLAPMEVSNGRAKFDVAFS